MMHALSFANILISHTAQILSLDITKSKKEFLQTCFRVMEGFCNRHYQQAHPPDCCSDWDECRVGLRLTSTMSSCLAEDNVSIPGKAAAIFRNNAWKEHMFSDHDINFCQGFGKCKDT